MVSLCASLSVARSQPRLTPVQVWAVPDAPQPPVDAAPATAAAAGPVPSAPAPSDGSVLFPVARSIAAAGSATPAPGIEALIGPPPCVLADPELQLDGVHPIGTWRCQRVCACVSPAKPLTPWR
jgi:hypothetical protein